MLSKWYFFREVFLKKYYSNHFQDDLLHTFCEEYLNAIDKNFNNTCYLRPKYAKELFPTSTYSYISNIYMYYLYQFDNKTKQEYTNFNTIKYYIDKEEFHKIKDYCYNLLLKENIRKFSIVEMSVFIVQCFTIFLCVIKVKFVYRECG